MLPLPSFLKGMDIVRGLNSGQNKPNPKRQESESIQSELLLGHPCVFCQTEDNAIIIIIYKIYIT